MPPKVASIFGAGQSRAKKPEIVQTTQKAESIQLDLDLDSLVDDNPPSAKPDPSINIQKPKYIFKALEKADERKALADEMKNLNIERELKKLEEQNGPYLHFSTTRSTESIDQIEDQESATEIKETNDIEIIQPEPVDFEGIKQRYMQRLELNDILKLNISEKKMNFILKFGELMFSEQ